MTVISYKDIPRFMIADAKAVDLAGAETLNAVAFRSLPALVADAQEQMKFSGNARAAMGWQVEKATRGNMRAVIQTRRKWTVPHLVEGQRQAKVGWQFEGRGYIVVPVALEAFSKRGKIIKTGYLKGLYVVRNGSGGLVYYRERKGDRVSKLIAILTPEADTHEDIEPGAVIQDIWERNATRFLIRYMRDARHKANAGGVF